MGVGVGEGGGGENPDGASGSSFAGEAAGDALLGPGGVGVGVGGEGVAANV